MLEEALEHLVKGIVDNPDDVQVAERNLRRGRVLEVRVHPDDLGKVIGRNGRTARSLRTVVGAIGGRGIRVDLVDGPGLSPPGLSQDTGPGAGSGRYASGPRSVPGPSPFPQRGRLGPVPDPPHRTTNDQEQHRCSW